MLENEVDFKLKIFDLLLLYTFFVGGVLMVGGVDRTMRRGVLKGAWVIQ